MLFAVCLWHVAFMGELVGDGIGHILSEPPPGQRTSQDQTVQALDSSIDTRFAPLENSSYGIGREAEAGRLKIGGPAIPFLRVVATDPDPGRADSEIQFSATRLWMLIERQDRVRKICKFLDGVRNDPGLNGWPAFSEIVGADRVSCKLYVVMHQAQRDLLVATEKDRNSVEETFHSASSLALRNNTYTNAAQAIGALTSLLSVSSLDPADGLQQLLSRRPVRDADVCRIQTVLTQTQLTTLVTGNGTRPLLGRLICQWLETLSNDENDSLMIRLPVARACRLGDSLPSIVKIANNRQLPPPTRINSSDVFGNLSHPMDASKLEALMDDQTVVGTTFRKPGAPHPNEPTMDQRLWLNNIRN